MAGGKIWKPDNYDRKFRGPITYMNTIGIALHCPLTRQISLRAFVSYDLMSTSSKFAQDYNKLDAGSGLGLTMRF